MLRIRGGFTFYTFLLLLLVNIDAQQIKTNTTLSCYTGFQGAGIGDSFTPTPFEPAGETAEDYRCVSYCTLCSKNISSSCTPGEQITAYAIVSIAEAASMEQNPATFKSLLECQTNNCNSPTGFGSCSIVTFSPTTKATLSPTYKKGAPTPLPTLAPSLPLVATLSCYTGFQGAGIDDSFTPTPFEPAGETAEDYRCVSYCTLCSKNISSSCTPGEQITAYAIVSIAEAASMEQNPATFKSLLECQTNNCNTPSKDNVCSGSTMAVQMTVYLTIVGCPWSEYQSNATAYRNALMSTILYDLNTASVPLSSKNFVTFGVEESSSNTFVVYFTIRSLSASYDTWASRIAAITNSENDQFEADLKEFARRFHATGLLLVSSVTAQISATTNVPSSEPVVSSNSSSLLDGLSESTVIGIGLGILVSMAICVVFFRARWAASRSPPLAKQDERYDASDDIIPVPSPLTRGSKLASGGTAAITQVGGRLNVGTGVQPPNAQRVEENYPI